MTTATLSRGSSPSVLTGSQSPTRLVVPPWVDTEWKDCHAVNAAGGIEMLEWQDAIMEGWLGRNKFGKWAAPTCGGSLSRQNGKSLGLVVPRANYGMVMLGEQVLYTSHLQKTSTETFESIAAFFDSKPLKKYVKDIKTALGREQVILKNGGRIKFLARTRNGGRGQHGDLLIFDEALELDSDSQSSFLPAISASRNPQVIYVSSPPTAQSVGTVFRNIRARALSGESERLAWFEWSVDEIGDVSDRSRWYATNPSLGILIQESTIESEFEQMDADTFARERLGWWSPVDASRSEFAIPGERWDELSTSSPPPDGKTAYGIRFSADGSEVCLCAALKHECGVHVEVVRRENTSAGFTWLAEFVADRKDEASVCVVDGKSGVQALVDRLERMPKGYLHVASAQDAVAAASTLLDLVNERKLSWYAPQGDLRDSAVTSTRRNIGNNGSWGFGGENPTPVTAASLAVWGVMTARRDPRRKGLVG